VPKASQDFFVSQSIKEAVGLYKIITWCCERFDLRGCLGNESNDISVPAIWVSKNV